MHHEIDCILSILNIRLIILLLFENHKAWTDVYKIRAAMAENTFSLWKNESLFQSVRV